ncbi:MAG: 30S ribosome-binding factor RbfA [Bdellovibrionales bacterium]
MKNMGDGRRIARVEKEVQIQIASYLQSGFSTPLPGLVTVAHVKMPADLRTARVFISVLGADDQTDEVIETLQERAFEIQDFIGRKLKMRYCPKLTFQLDHTTDQVLKIEKILHEISTSKKSTDEL